MKNLKLIGFLMILASSLMFIQCTSDPIAGADGIDGIAGIDGIDGVNGVDGEGIQTCVACHSDSHLDPVHDAYAMSGHATGFSWNYEHAATSTDCAQCHNNQGYVDYLSENFTIFNEATDEHVQSVNPNGYTAMNAITCNGCHLEHRSFDFENDGNDYALRNIDAVALVIDPTVEIDFANDSDPLGLSNSCTTCHQPRNSYPVPGGADPVTITSKRYGPHHSPQATLLEGIMGSNLAGSAGYPGSGGNGDNGHRTGSSCTACHMGESTNTAEGGHTWMPNEEACITCHTNGAPSEVSGFEADLAILHELLMEHKLVDAAGYVLGDDGVTSASADNPLNTSSKNASAIWNFKTLEEDRSNGVHNPKYSKALLKNSIEALPTIQ